MCSISTIGMIAISKDCRIDIFRVDSKSICGLKSVASFDVDFTIQEIQSVENNLLVVGKDKCVVKKVEINNNNEILTHEVVSVNANILKGLLKSNQ